MKIVDFFYAEGQTAEVLGVNRLTVYRWIKKGRFDVQHVGGVALVPKWEVELFKLGRKVSKGNFDSNHEIIKDVRIISNFGFNKDTSDKLPLLN